jgi:hypothetical protein
MLYSVCDSVEMASVDRMGLCPYTVCTSYSVYAVHGIET